MDRRDHLAILGDHQVDDLADRALIEGEGIRVDRFGGQRSSTSMRIGRLRTDPQARAAYDLLLELRGVSNDRRHRRVSRSSARRPPPGRAHARELRARPGGARARSPPASARRSSALDRAALEAFVRAADGQRAVAALGRAHRSPRSAASTASSSSIGTSTTAQPTTCARRAPGRRCRRSCRSRKSIALLAAPDVATPRGLRDRALIELLYATGLRVSSWSASARPTCSSTSSYLTCIGKGSKERMVPIGDEARAWVRRYSARGPAGAARRAGRRRGSSSTRAAAPLTRVGFWKF